MKKNNIRKPYLRRFYDNYSMGGYLQNLRRFNVRVNAKKISLFAKLTMLILSIIGIMGLMHFEISLFLAWLPVAISIVIGMLLESFFISFIPSIKCGQYAKEYQKEKEKKELEKKLQSLKPPVFDYEFVLNQVQQYSTMEISEVLTENFRIVCEDLRNLVYKLQENNIDVEKYSTLFKKYVPDIIEVLKDYDKSDSQVEMKVKVLLENFHMYMLSEIEDASLGRKMSTNSTIEAYNSLFQGTSFGG